MSRIYFHSEQGDAEILGSERAHLGSVADSVGFSPINGYSLRSMSKWLTLNFYGKTVEQCGFDAELVETAQLALLVGFNGDRTMAYQGLALDPWQIGLNTAIRLGSRPVQLAARVHSQCEIYGWVDGPNRAWLADIIDEGLASRVLRGPHGPDDNRRDAGWATLIEFLRSDATGPVVMSSSHGEQFPNPEISTWTAPTDVDDDKWNVWNDLTDADKWRTSMDALRAGDGFLEMKPDDWNTYAYAHNGLTWMDILEGETRLREVLELDAATVDA